MSTGSVLKEVDIERLRQDEKWGGPQHDDKHEPRDFMQFITIRTFDFTMLGPDDYLDARRRFIQIAALAVAAVESIDRWKAS